MTRYNAQKTKALIVSLIPTWIFLIPVMYFKSYDCGQMHNECRKKVLKRYCNKGYKQLFEYDLQLFHNDVHKTEHLIALRLDC